MPVKVRCSDCETVFKAPDAARGKAVKCPRCESRVRVPTGSGQRKKTARRKKVASRRPADDDDFLGGVDSRRMEDSDRPICPKCAIPVDFDDIECPKCGVNLETGQLSAKQKRKRRQRGPDRDEYWGKVWQDSMAFIGNNIGMTLHTGVYWTFMMMMYSFSLFMTLVYCVPDEPQWYPSPTQIFWGFLAILFLVGIGGWGWALTLEVIKTTMAGKDKLGKVNSDFFTNVSLGFKSIIWPYVLWSPVFIVSCIIIVPMVLFFAVVLSFPFMAIPISMCLYALPYLVIPVAMVHMTMPYTYKAWLPVDMLKITFKNIGPVSYLCVTAIAVFLPMIIVSVLISIFGIDLLVYLMGTADDPGLIGRWVVKIVEAIGWDWVAIPIALMLWFVASFIIYAPIAFLLAFPSMFMMRGIGLFGYYFRDDLELVKEHKANTPAGFWIRYLAHLVDATVIGSLMSLITVIYGLALLVLWMVSESEAMVGALTVPLYIILGVFPFLYYVFSESGPGSATLGKRALGLVVTDMEFNRPVSKGIAIARFFVRGATQYFGWIVAAFTERKQTLHDMATKTVVVHKGEIF